MLLPVISPVKGRKTPAKRVGTEAAAVDGAGRKRQWKHREATREEVGTSARARASFEAHEAHAALDEAAQAAIEARLLDRLGSATLISLSQRPRASRAGLARYELEKQGEASEVKALQPLAI